MKKASLLVITIIAIVVRCPAQCFLLKVNMNDCALCTAGSSTFNPLKTGLPAFVIYPTSFREDSADIDYAGKFSEHNIKVLFNDSWAEKLTCSNSISCVFGLDRDGKVVYSSPLKSLNSAAIDTFLQKHRAEKSVIAIQRDSFLYTLNGLGVIKIYNATDKHLERTIRFADFDLQRLANKMTGSEKQRFEKYGDIINKKTSAFLGQFTDVQLTGKGDLFVKLLYHTTPDSLTINIDDDHAIVHYDARGSYKDVYPIAKSKDFFLNDRSILLANEDTFYAVIENGVKRIEPENPTSEIDFIGCFVKKSGHYAFNGYVPFKLPYIYQLKFEYNYLSSSASYFPLVVNKFSNTVYNIATKKAVFIIDSAKYMAGIDTFSFDPQVSIETHEKLNVRAIRPVFGQPNLYAMPYVYEDRLYINFYTADLAKKHTFYWGDATIGKNRIVSATGREGQDVFLVIYVDKDKTWTSVAMPMSLFLPGS